MDLLVLPDGTVRALYAEEIDLADLGSPSSSGPAMSSRIDRAAGLPICRPSPARFWDRSAPQRGPSCRAEVALTSLAGARLLNHFLPSPRPEYATAMLRALRATVCAGGLTWAAAGREETTMTQAQLG